MALLVTVEHSVRILDKTDERQKVKASLKAIKESFAARTKAQHRRGQTEQENRATLRPIFSV